MDDFWKYLIVANNIAMVWMVFIVAKSKSNRQVMNELNALKAFLVENAKADTQLFANTRILIGSLKDRVEKLENPEQSESVDVKDS